MKRSFVVAAIFLLALAVLTANAQGGYKGPGPGIITVEAAKKLKDDSPVTLRGKIDKFLGDEKYAFSDNTGKINIEIDNNVWGALSVNEKETVEISGEIDKDIRKTEVDVKTIKKVE